MARTKVNGDSLARFSRLFKGRENAHGEYRKHLNKQNRTAQGGPTLQMYTNHLRGQGFVLGVVPLTQENVCYFGAIDLDDDEVNHAALAAMVEHAKLPLVVCRSKSGGAHLYAFLKDPVNPTLLRARLKDWAERLKLTNPEQQLPGGKRKPKPIEIFPKSAQYQDDDSGNWINIPYFDQAETIRYAVAPDGSRLGLPEFLDYAEACSISSFDLEAQDASDTPFGKGPPCLEQLDELGYPEGSRNMGLLNVAIAFKAMGADDWQSQVSAYNEDKFDPPLSNTEVRAVIKSVDQRDYHYKCDELPIQPYCKKSICQKREFGISLWKRRRKHDNLPELTNLRKVTTDPPRWLVELSGKDVELTTEDLMLLARFRKAVMERCNQVFPLMSQPEWDNILAGLLDNLAIIEAPADAGISGQFRQLLGDFLFRRHQAHRKEDLLAGMPVQVGNLVYFRGTDFANFLQRKHFREYNQAKLFTALRTMGAGHDQLNIKKQCVQVWFIAAPNDEQTEEFDPLVETDPEM